MRSLPRNAQLYLSAIYLLGSAALVSACFDVASQPKAKLWELIVFIVLAMLAGGQKIKMMRHKTQEDVGSMSLGFAISFAAMQHFGPGAGALVAITSCLSSGLYPKRQSLYQLAFNSGLGVLDTWIAGCVFLWLNGGTLQMRPFETFMAVVGSSLTSFLINTGGVAVIIALCSGQKALQLWKETFLWTAPSYFAGACVSTLALILFGRHIVPILLFVSPVAYLTYQSYQTYLGRQEEKQLHIEELQVNQANLADLYLATIKSLALAIDAKDQYTHQHILRVQRYAVAIAKHMGLTGAELEGVNTGALLHDIGKLGVPEYILLKPGRLTDDEFAKIKKHPEIGAAILDPVEFPWPVLPGVKYHHEKWDGTGYPEGLSGENIPLTARILAVADVYDALTSSRSYRTAWTHERALSVIKKDAGTHFDPIVVDSFMEVIDGVVQEMAAQGEGPLVPPSKIEQPKTKMEGAARDIQRASSELWAMYEVAQTLSSSLGLQETIDILARKLEAIFPGGACVFLLKENAKNENAKKEDKREGGQEEGAETGQETLVARAAVGLNYEFLQEARTLGAHCKSLQVANTRQTYVGEYDADDLLLTSSQSAQWVTFQTALIVSIVHQGEVLGTINLYSPHPDAFSVHDKQLLETIAERAAMALYNGLLFDRTRGHAFTDPVTGVYNIRYLTQYVEERCRTANEEKRRREEEKTEEDTDSAFPLLPSPFALLCLDLDSFKPINDNFGHQKGDRVLNALANVFQATVCPSDVVARYGGDKFLIVLDGADAHAAHAMCERLQKAVESYDPDLIHPKLGALHLGVSIGYACFPQDGDNCTRLLSAADLQMYHQKTERKLGSLAGKERTMDAPAPAVILRQAA
jgi:diguanylate cyclase (GGDEF)-like protein/putative nucleotidyltransferase with HDIG domain